MDDLIIAGRSFKSRLLVGTGKFSSNAAMVAAMEASGCEIVTVALRRVDIDNPERQHARPHRPAEVPAAAQYQRRPRRRGGGAPGAAGPRRRLRAVDQAGGHPRSLSISSPIRSKPSRPRRSWSRKASSSSPTSTPTRSWPSACRRSAPPRSCRWARRSAPTRGLRTREQIAIIIEQAIVPVIVDAGLGAPSHAAEAMEMGADAVLVNTALAVARDPAGMAAAFRKGVEAGREAYLAGLGGAATAGRSVQPADRFSAGKRHELSRTNIRVKYDPTDEKSSGADRSAKDGHATCRCRGALAAERLRPRRFHGAPLPGGGRLSGADGAARPPHAPCSASGKHHPDVRAPLPLQRVHQRLPLLRLQCPQQGAATHPHPR